MGTSLATCFRCLYPVDENWKDQVCPNCQHDHARHTTDWHPGDVVARHLLINLIGTGGMGEVWRAEKLPEGTALPHGATGEARAESTMLRAVKFMKVVTPDLISRFQHECLQHARLNHPNIATLHDHGVFERYKGGDGHPFISMELVECRREGATPPREAAATAVPMHKRSVTITEYADLLRLSVQDRIRLFIKVCASVSYLHAVAKITHRDLKPENILVSDVHQDPEPKLIDFGIARLSEGPGLTRDQFVSPGTYTHMAPEQHLSKLATPATDVYALGCILCSLLIGRLPHEENELLALKKHNKSVGRVLEENEPPRPGTLFEHLPESQKKEVAERRGTTPQELARLLRSDLDWIVRRCLLGDVPEDGKADTSSSRNERYARPDQLARSLTDFLEGRPVPDHPGLFYPLRKLALRHRVATFAAGVAILALVAGLGASLYFLSSSREAEKQAVSSKLKADETSKKLTIESGKLQNAITDLIKETQEKEDALQKETEATAIARTAEKNAKDAAEKALAAQKSTADAVNMARTQAGLARLERVDPEESYPTFLPESDDPPPGPTGYFSNPFTREGIAYLARAARDGVGPALQRLSNLVQSHPQAEFLGRYEFFTEEESTAWLATFPKDKRHTIIDTPAVTVRFARDLRSLTFSGPLVGKWATPELPAHRDSDEISVAFETKYSASPGEHVKDDDPGSVFPKFISRTARGGRYFSPSGDLEAEVEFRADDKDASDSRLLTVTLRNTKTKKVQKRIIQALGAQVSEEVCGTFSSDGRRFSLVWSGGTPNMADSRLWMWDTSSGQPLLVIDPHYDLPEKERPSEDLAHLGKDDIRAISFSPCGEWLITGHGDGSIGLHLLRFREDEAPSDKPKTGQKKQAPRLFVARQVWITSPAAAAGYDAVMMSPDGQLLCAMTQDYVCCLWRLGAQKQPHDVVPFVKGDGFAYSQDGQLLAHMRTPHRLDVISIRDGKLVRRFEQKTNSLFKYGGLVEFSPSGRWLVLATIAGEVPRSAGLPTVALWDLQTNTSNPEWAVPTKELSGILFNKDESMAVALVDSKTGTDAYLLDLQKHSAVKLASADAELPLIHKWAFAVSDGKPIVSVLLDPRERNREAQRSISRGRWALPNGELLPQEKLEPLDFWQEYPDGDLIQCSPDHTLVAYETGTQIGIWNLLKKQLESPFISTRESSSAEQRGYTMFSFSPGYVAVGTSSNPVKGLAGWGRVTHLETGLVVNEAVQEDILAQGDLNLSQDQWLDWGRRHDIAPLPLSSGICDLAEAMAGCTVEGNPAILRRTSDAEWASKWLQCRASLPQDGWMGADAQTRSITPRAQVSVPEWIWRQMVQLTQDEDDGRESDLRLTFPFHPLTYAGLALLEAKAGRHAESRALARVAEASLDRQITMPEAAERRAPPPLVPPLEPHLAGRIRYWLGHAAGVRQEPGKATPLYEAAVADLKAACTVYPQDPLPRCLLGNCYQALNQPAAQLKAYDDAVRCDPRHAMALSRRALLRMERNDVKGALEDINRGLLAAPHSIILQDLEPLALLRLGRIGDSAAAAKSRNSRMDGWDDTGGYTGQQLSLASSLAQLVVAALLKDEEGAATLMRDLDLGTLDMDRAVVGGLLSDEHWAIASNYMRKEKASRMGASLMNEIDVSMDNPQALADILKRLDPIIARYPEEALFVMLRARVHQLRGKSKEAKLDYERASHLENEDVALQVGCAMAMLAMSEPKRAQSILERSLPMLKTQDEVVLVRGVAAIAASARFPLPDEDVASEHYQVLVAFFPNLAGTEEEAAAAIRAMLEGLDFMIGDEVDRCTKYLLRARQSALTRAPEIRDAQAREALKARILKTLPPAKKVLPSR